MLLQPTEYHTQAPLYPNPYGEDDCRMPKRCITYRQVPYFLNDFLSLELCVQVGTRGGLICPAIGSIFDIPTISGVILIKSANTALPLPPPNHQVHLRQIGFRYHKHLSFLTLQRNLCN